LNTAHLSITFLTCFYFDKDKYALNLLRDILSSSMSSRLFTLLREKHGLTYASSATTIYYECGGDFSINVEVDKNKMMYFASGNKNTKRTDTISGRSRSRRSRSTIRSTDTTSGRKDTTSGRKEKGVVPLLVELIKQLKRGDITEKELALAKTNMRGKMLLRQENTDNQCMYNGKVLMILSDVEKLDKSGIVPFSQLFDKYYNGITLKDINGVIGRYFTANNMVVGIVSSKLPDLGELKREFDGL
jgi:predicted Zn-dependent peptidase